MKLRRSESFTERRKSLTIKTCNKLWQDFSNHFEPQVRMGDSFLSSYNGVSASFKKCMDQADPSWRKVSSKDIAADSDWFVSAEEVFVDEIIENITVGCVNRKIQRDHEKRAVEVERIKRESILAIKELSLNPPTIMSEVLKKNVNFTRI